MNELFKAKCLNCERVTIDSEQLITLNDLDSNCLDCGFHVLEWTMKDGSKVFTMEDNQGESSRLAVSEAINV